MKEFRNESGLKFTDISSEEWREYIYDYNKTIFIENPLKLHVSKSGGHRIFSAEGYSRYIAPGWLQIIWRSKDNEPHFIK